MDIATNQQYSRGNLIYNLLKLLLITCLCQPLTHIIPRRVLNQVVIVDNDLVENLSHELGIILLQLHLENPTPLLILCLGKCRGD